MIQLNWMASESLDPLVFTSMSTEITGVHYCIQLFHMDAGNLNSDPQASTEGVLPTEPFPQSIEHLQMGRGLAVS